MLLLVLGSEGWSRAQTHRYWEGIRGPWTLGRSGAWLAMKRRGSAALLLRLPQHSQSLSLLVVETNDQQKSLGYARLHGAIVLNSIGGSGNSVGNCVALTKLFFFLQGGRSFRC